jgi:acetyl-CoA synthetase
VSPKIFESILVAHAEVSEAAAIAVPDSIKGEALVCFCVLKKAQTGPAAAGSRSQPN